MAVQELPLIGQDDLAPAGSVWPAGYLDVVEESAVEEPKLVAAEIEQRYGIRLISPRPPVWPTKMDLNGSKGHRLWMAEARRVMATHAKVLAALAKRYMDGLD